MNVEKKKLVKDGMVIAYTLHIKKVKNLTLRINETGELIVTCNAYIPQEKIESFVVEKVKWIITKQQQVIRKANMYYDDILSDTLFYLFGKPLKIVRIQSNQNKVQYDDENFYVYYIDEKDAHKSVISIMQKICKQEFMPIVDYYYEKLKEYRFAYPQVKFRTMKSRWGSCIPSKNQVTLNMRMIHYPKAFLEYVVLHELVHFIQPNHSAAFYQIIQFHMPDYKTRMQLVK
ncbi:MAG: SprT family zinc-dependent metalloprotease [Bacilli bacterium]|nr:SprT family zinc-dependent metalloprotease [Bacilli bacterium]